MPFFLKFKSTFLLLFILFSTCAQKQEEQTEKITPEPKQLKKEVVVAANRTEAYLPYLKDKNIAIVANQTSVIFKTKGYTHLVDSLLSLDVAIKKVFAPEHGFRGKADAGELVKDGMDAKTGISRMLVYVFTHIYLPYS